MDLIILQTAVCSKVIFLYMGIIIFCSQCFSYLDSCNAMSSNYSIVISSVNFVLICSFGSDLNSSFLFTWFFSCNSIVIHQELLVFVLSLLLGFILLPRLLLLFFTIFLAISLYRMYSFFIWILFSLYFFHVIFFLLIFSFTSLFHQILLFVFFL